jgi:hypothetical protein
MPNKYQVDLEVPVPGRSRTQNAHTEYRAALVTRPEQIDVPVRFSVATATHGSHATK